MISSILRISSRPTLPFKSERHTECLNCLTYMRKKYPDQAASPEGRAALAKKCADNEEFYEGWIEDVTTLEEAASSKPPSKKKRLNSQVSQPVQKYCKCLPFAFPLHCFLLALIWLCSRKTRLSRSAIRPSSSHRRRAWKHVVCWASCGRQPFTRSTSASRNPRTLRRLPSPAGTMLGSCVTTHMVAPQAPDVVHICIVELIAYSDKLINCLLKARVTFEVGSGFVFFRLGCPRLATALTAPPSFVICRVC